MSSVEKRPDDDDSAAILSFMEARGDLPVANRAAARSGTQEAETESLPATAENGTVLSAEMSGRLLGRRFLQRRLGFIRPALLLWIAAILLMTVPMVTLVDVPAARWFASKPLPKEVGDAVNLMRVFSHGSGIFLILVAIFLMAPRLRWHLPRLATLAMGAGAVATLAKMFVLRPRPSGLNLDMARHDSAWLWAFDWNLSQVAAFDASTRSFPSGDVATAVALTVGLWAVLPRGRWLFAAICLGTLVQRMHSGAHFVSDLCGGAAFGLLWAYTCTHPKLLGSLFDKMQPEASRRRRTEQETSETAESQGESVSKAA